MSLMRIACAVAAGLCLAATPARLVSRQVAQPTFRGGTALVEVSAVITSGGQTVADLRREDVEVRDNGVPQELVAFEYVDLTTTTGAAQRRDFVIVLDDLHVEARQTKATQDVALAFIDALGPHDRLAIVNTGPIELVMQFSTNRQQARTLVRKFRGQKGAQSSQQRDANARIHLQVIRNVARAMEGDPAERRAVLVIGEGHFMEPGTGRPGDPDPRVFEDFNDVVRAAALANVAIYGVNPTGLVVGGQLRVAGQSRFGATDKDVALTSSVMASQLAEGMSARRHGSVGRLADSTGGILTIDRNALDADIPRLMQDSRQYYRLAYVQPDVNPADSSKERRIEVKVLREGVDVRSRKAYRPR